MNSKERQAIQNKVRAKRVFQLRAMGLSVKEVAGEIGCERHQVRTLQVLGERLLSAESEKST